MREEYRVVDVSDWAKLDYPEVGTKDKDWLCEPFDRGGRWGLFKYRQNEATGDDWAERIAAECATALRIPHANVELATRNGKRGVFVLAFTSLDRGDDLHLGNSLLQQIDPGYAGAKRSRVADYTLERAFKVLEQPFVVVPPSWDLPKGVVSAADVFTGFLLLDALIANQDRNHQNWGVIQRAGAPVESRLELVPSFDHASSLGRSLSDVERVERMTTHDRGYAIEAFASKAKSKFRVGSGPGRYTTTFDAFRWALARRPSAGMAWLEELRRVDDAALRAMVLAVPTTMMSPIAQEFTERLLVRNRAALLSASVP